MLLGMAYLVQLLVSSGWRHSTSSQPSLALLRSCSSILDPLATQCCRCRVEDLRAAVGVTLAESVAQSVQAEHIDPERQRDILAAGPDGQRDLARRLRACVGQRAPVRGGALQGPVGGRILCGRLEGEALRRKASIGPPGEDHDHQGGARPAAVELALGGHRRNPLRDKEGTGHSRRRSRRVYRRHWPVPGLPPSARRAPSCLCCRAMATSSANVMTTRKMPSEPVNVLCSPPKWANPSTAK